ncbi:hypothetical protein E2C01_018082 [Portunus trituberculatus]|uniref:Uncharacterized protein n=1 Tax=Portunus trituberculatus TaxID=210409 RepID=A0A5B7DV83_PORTR|nr:hypothetical protein [Portunus trituberculatus]
MKDTQTTGCQRPRYPGHASTHHQEGRALRRFLGMVGFYRHFCPKFASVKWEENLYQVWLMTVMKEAVVR